MPFWLTWELVPIVKPLELSDWMRSERTALAPDIRFEASPLIEDVRPTAICAVSAFTMTRSGWKPTEIGRLSVGALPVYEPVAIR